MSKYEARSRRIYVHVTAAEEELLKSRATAGGYAFLGAYVRDVALGGPVKVIYRDAAFDDLVGEFKRFRREIPGIIDAVACGDEAVEHSLKSEFEKILQMAIKIYELCMSR
jgi:hypothetical protein